MIGGHKQLTPKLEFSDLAAYKLHVSFFERVLVKRSNQKQLQVQHRMAPEMTKLISPLIYPEMEHDASVLDLPPLKILTKRVSFVDHQIEEDDLPEFDESSQALTNHWSGSNRNEKEALFVVDLCKYLVSQGIPPEDITILTIYSAQTYMIFQLLKKDLLPEFESFRAIETATVDNYQGGENKIIILSLVRSNPLGFLGLLDDEKRIGVALSKAKDALVIVGNMKTLSTKSSTWNSMKKVLIEQGALSHSLELRCSAYPMQTHLVSLKERYKLDRICSEDTCKGPLRSGHQTVEQPASVEENKRCGKTKNCGHICNVEFHPDEKADFHQEKCWEPCLRTCKSCLHRCRLLCNLPCLPCPEVRVVTFSCGRHSKEIVCSDWSPDSDCEEECGLPMQCGHSCSKKCHEPCATSCRRCSGECHEPGATFCWHCDKNMYILDASAAGLFVSGVIMIAILIWK
ncbi:NFX1-type zinc finger-containing protein 1-like [Cloeon dipterum]|uniref:NFX1-type zinc finger-containing protein 1-like n=1 Tax=Cloeon dipterum TaxID=197152 RepID=UPI00321F6773